jgi:hypothetical protein
MENQLKYSFDDEIVSKFCYDMDNKKIEVHFNGCFDLQKNEYIERACTLVIENWSDATSRIGDETKFYALDKHMGIFSLILSIERTEEGVQLLVNSVDDRYITLSFKKPQIHVVLGDVITF